MWPPETPAPFACLDPSVVGVACALCGGTLLGWWLARRLVVPFDEDRYFPLTEPGEVPLREALEMCGAIRDHTTRCYFKGRIREMVRLQPISDEGEFAKMSRDLRAEVDDCLHFGTCFRFHGPDVHWDVSRLPPGPSRVVVGAELGMDVKRVHRVLCKLSKRYGKVFPMQLEGNPLWVVVSGAREAKAIFHDNGATTSGRTFGQAHLITHTDFPAGNFLRCPFTEDLKKRRGVVWREALSKQKVELFRPILERCRHLSVRAFLAAAEGGGPFQPRALLRMSYLNTLACILFGISFADVDDPEYRRVYEFVDDEANELLMGAADVFPPLRRTPLYTRKAARMKHIRERQDAWLHEKIGARQRHLAEGKEPQTFCDILLQTMTSPCPGQRLSYENVKEICNEIIFAGTDTTATTTETVLAHLLNNPGKAAKLREELDEVFGPDRRMPGPSDFSRLRYTNAVIKEAMRMTCAVPFNGHTCSEDTEVLGYRIPKGALCINNIYAVHYDPEIYPSPEEFRPERWLDKDPCRWPVENDFEFMPFGVGRRLCLGYNLALENLQLFVASLFLGFEFSTPDGRPVSMKEETDFTVSVPAFRACARVRGGTALSDSLEHFRALPPATLVALGTRAGPVADAAAPSPQHLVAAPPQQERWAVWYGSQTGTAEGFANAMARAARRRGVVCTVRSLERASDGRLCPEGEAKTIFIAATFGNGEPADNAVGFHSWLREGSVEARGLRYAVFGLGNSEYEHYNAAGRFIDARLAELGGLRLEGVPLGLGDASKDLDGAFEEWMATLLDAHAPAEEVKSEAGAQGPTAGEPQGQPQATCAWRVLWQPARQPEAQPNLGRRTTHVSQLAASSVAARVAGVRELARRPEVNGSVVEVALDLAGSGLQYSTADTIGVFPRNSPESVEAFAALLNQPLDAAFTLVPAEPADAQDLPFPCPSTVREVLSSVVDILGKPGKRLVAELARLCGDGREREELLMLASPAGKARWEELAGLKELSLLQLFRRYRSLSAAPLASFLELAPQMRLKPRYYTASSCPMRLGGDRLSLTVKVLRDRHVELGAGPARLPGVASGFLAAARERDEVRLFVQPSGFALPRDPAVPVIMVATGTGLAPFRGFLEERAVLGDGGAALGEAVLFFGCARRDADFICEAELQAHLNRGTLTELVTAFSREEPGRKTYVQHRLAERGEALRCALLDRGAHLYVCGSTAMGRAVKEAVVRVLSAKASRGEAERTVGDLERQGRYVAELWA